MSGLLELAERCARATGPDWKLDLAIFEAADPEAYRGSVLGAYHRADRVTPPSYTASLDAAMTLVPLGQQFGCGSKDATDRAWAWAGQFSEGDYIANAATPALALCAAALRARASISHHEQGEEL